MSANLFTFHSRPWSHARQTWRLRTSLASFRVPRRDVVPVMSPAGQGACNRDANFVSPPFRPGRGQRKRQEAGRAVRTGG